MPRNLESGQSPFVNRCLVCFRDPGCWLTVIVCVQIMCTLFGLWYLTNLTHNAVDDIQASVQALQKSPR
jgi:hypothetical protein